MSSPLAGRFSTTEPLGKPLTESLMKKTWLCFIQELDPLLSLPAQLGLLSSLVFISSQELGSRGHLSISCWKNGLQGTSLKLLGKRPPRNAGVRSLFSPLTDMTWPLLTSGSEREAPPVGGKDGASLSALSSWAASSTCRPLNFFYWQRGKWVVGELVSELLPTKGSGWSLNLECWASRASFFISGL